MKVIKDIINILTTLIIVVGILFLTLFLFGITPYVVLSGSMEPKIQTGSLCFVNKHSEYWKVKEKDIIAFKFNNNKLVTHRVIEVTNEGLVTQGDNSDTPDGSLVTKDNFVGKNIFSIPKVGYAIKAIQTAKGKIIFGTCIAMLFIAGLLLGEDGNKKTKRKNIIEIPIKK